ncbi:MAG: hypothetical protein KDD42_02005, partial [Bdellovibrionales bacterium]|nr:hypothetical protein [Bdellovibrionales bacterium]
MQKQKKAKATCFDDQIIQTLCQLLPLAFVLTALVLSGCSKRYHDMPSYWPIPVKQYDNQGVGRFKTAFLVEQIDQYYRGTNPGPIGVTTLVNLDDLYSTSSFG